jgi:hypothetical protein
VTLGWRAVFLSALALSCSPGPGLQHVRESADPVPAAVDWAGAVPLAAVVLACATSYDRPGPTAAVLTEERRDPRLPCGLIP